MSGEILRVPGGHINAVNVRVSEGRIDADGVDGLIVAAPRKHVPGVTGLLFMGQQPDFAGAPVEQGNIVLRALLRLIAKSNAAAVVRPPWTLLANVGRVCQVDDFSTVAGDRVKIPKFITGVVLLVDDPFAIRGPRSAILPLVGLSQLNRPSAGGVLFPQIGPAGDVTGEYDLLSVGRPGGAENILCEVKVVDRRGPRGRV